MDPQTTPAPAPVYTVRAMPAQGHERRWCAQRPFTRDLIEVVVVDKPAPHVHVRENGRETAKIAAYSYEVTPLELEELKRDRHLVVQVKGNPDADPGELNAAKARAMELEQKLTALALEHSERVEECKQLRIGALQRAEVTGGQLAAMQQEIENLRSQLSEASRKKGR